MAKQSSIQKNLNRKKIVSKFDNRRKILKKKIMQKDLTMEERFKLQSKLNDLPRDSSNIRVRNRCLITGRTRGVYRKVHKICSRVTQRRSDRVCRWSSSNNGNKNHYWVNQKGYG